MSQLLINQYLNELATLIQTGVAMVFLAKKKGQKGGAVIRYARRPEMETAEEKLSAISSIGGLSKLVVETIQPDRNNDWLNVSDNSWDKLTPLVDPSVSVGRTTSQHKAIFRLMSNGLKTQRDDWAYDVSKDGARPCWTCTSGMKRPHPSASSARTRPTPGALRARRLP